MQTLVECANAPHLDPLPSKGRGEQRALAMFACKFTFSSPLGEEERVG